ncbi:COG5398 Heme oxygenase [uncultured Caudovirales phage]|uniref:COG5398 Heme oxygenase n=1 Tax=uncultured Caudovirales phage TaxID=2100421 RepID=A0A6J7WIK1_9CAUD|nr:COG5398 Heme oxygenase [uncultured Caudovirales phage]CAB5208698.1 COG5398 Heme oxygenase [uncultured Caudovirales phage]
MSNLRELTKEAHTNAERQEFVKILFSGKINPKLYATFLKNQHPCYEILEVCAMPHQLLNGLPDVCRASAILSDFQELWTAEDGDPQILSTTEQYIKYILSIKDDPKRLMAHIYVRHMGDLAGGQMIAKKVPGSGKYYQFADPDGLKMAIRERLDDSMAEEATVCFGFATDMFKEMMNLVEFTDEQ